MGLVFKQLLKLLLLIHFSLLNNGWTNNASGPIIFLLRRLSLQMSYMGQLKRTQTQELHLKNYFISSTSWLKCSKSFLKCHCWEDILKTKIPRLFALLWKELLFKPRKHTSLLNLLWCRCSWSIVYILGTEISNS